jgi:hypothetical protein
MDNPFEGLAGRIETAHIIIADFRKAAEEQQKKTAAALAAQNALNKAAQSVRSEAAKAAASIARKAAQISAEGNTGGGAIRRAVKTVSGEGVTSAINKLNEATTAFNAATAAARAPWVATNKTFKVQFNPSELELDGHLYPVNMSDSRTTQQLQGRRVATTMAVAPRVDLTVKLIFDQVNIYDSFMAEKFSAGLSVQGAKNVATGIAQAAGKVWSVQKEVEGFIAALRNPYTRYITFAWSTFSFAGRLKHIDARYTMFSVSGRPVRATVTLRLTQDMYNLPLNTWLKDFNDAFSGDNSNLVTPGQVVGNVFNLGI